MKFHLLLIIPILLLIPGCSKSPFDRAKKNVTQYIKTMLNDDNYYESVSWGRLDSSVIYPGMKSIHFTDPEDQRFIEYELLPYAKERGITKKEAINTFITKNKMTPGKDYTVTISDSFKFKGYTIEHVFRIRGQEKQKLLVKYKFTLDTTLNVIGIKKQKLEAIDSE